MPRTPAALLAVLFLFPALASPGATPGTAQEASPEDASAVEAVIRELFDAMRAADSAAARPLFHPETRLARPVERDGGVALEISSVDGFLDAIGGAEPGAWDERITDPRIRVDGDLATAWMGFTFYLQDELSHCGVNAVQLYRAPDGWKIFHVADTRRTEGCPDRR